MKEKLVRLKELIAEIKDIEYAIALLEWDQQTGMPSGGAEDRAHQLTTLSRIAHDKFTSDDMGSLLDSLDSYAKSLDQELDDACLIRKLRRNYDKQVKVPSELVAEFATLTALGQHNWERAREESDFARFQPYLERIVENRKQYADIFKPYNHIYDSLLDDYEEGLKTADVKQIFDTLRPPQVELIKAIREQVQVDDSFLHMNYDAALQWELGEGIISSFGYDWKRGRQDSAAHPFTTTIGLGDVRITTRIMKNHLFSGLASSMHEAGHAIYEQGIARSLDRTPLGTGTSLGVHESQSRLWENLVGRSREFCDFVFPKFKERFPSELGHIGPDQFYRGINKVAPSLIRVEADEATYNLHVMLRLELELALIEGVVNVSDLPEVWNLKMTDYLDVTPANDREGVLQDVHWSCGLFGYFSTYALGNLISVQLWKCIQKDLPDLKENIRSGRFGELREWLKENIHRHGAKFTPQDLVKRVTGGAIDPAPYIAYLKSKFGAIYGI